MPKQTGQCELCGKTFEAWPSQKRRFCSRSCQSTVRGRELWETRAAKPTKPRRGETVPCLVCGGDVYRNRSQTRKGAGKYCSKACLYQAMTKTPVVKACARCGVEMALKPSQAHRVYCSKLCDGLARTKRPGDRLHNGKPVRYDAQGYVMVWQPDHPNQAFHGWQYEHRLVAEQVLGRLLTRDEHVHHINHMKDDNDSENLEVMDGLKHAALSARDYRDLVQRERAELEEYRRRYGPLEPED